MVNLDTCFRKDQKIMLKNIEFNTIETIRAEGKIMVEYSDKVISELKDQNYFEICLTRVVKFNPENIFYLSVTFSDRMYIADDHIDDTDWSEYDLAKALMEAGSGVLANLAARASLMVSQITAAFNTIPIVTPPQPILKRRT